MQTLPSALLVEIVARVGKDGFRYLGPFIAASKQTKTAVFSPTVLKSVDLSEFMAEASMVNKTSIYRSFFSACVEAGNVIGNQLEGLRLLCQDGPSDEAFAMVSLAGENSVFTIFITGVFQICAGHFYAGMRKLRRIWHLYVGLEEAVATADLVMEQIVRMGPANTGMYVNTHTYPLVELPSCTYISCTAESVCEVCFAFWYSLLIRSIC